MKSPTPEQIKQARTAAGHSQKRASDVIHSTERAWQSWEQAEGGRKMHPGLWELYLLKTSAFPLLRKYNQLS